MTSGEELLELRKSTGMNRREFAEYFEIPYRTVQDWEPPGIYRYSTSLYGRCYHGCTLCEGKRSGICR